MNLILKILGWKKINEELVKRYSRSLYISPYSSFKERLFITLALRSENILYKKASKKDPWKKLKNLYAFLIYPYQNGSWDKEFYKISCGVVSKEDMIFIKLDKRSKTIEFIGPIKAPLTTGTLDDLLKGIYKNTLSK